MSINSPKPKSRRSLVPSLLIYLCYVALIISMRSSMEDGKLNPAIGTWWVHLLMLFYGWSEFTQWRWLKKRRPKKVQEVTS